MALGLVATTVYDKCMALASNLWWSWHQDVINIFRDLDPIRWRQLDHNPIALLAEFTPERLEMRAAELVLYSRVNHAYRRLKEYLTETPLWARTHAGVLGSKPVAYFSLEFGVHESVPIYSGGLGVLSGDHVKSASALGVPLVASGLFYDQGYFKQQLDMDGLQGESYVDTKVENLPIQPARTADGRPITVEIQTRTGRLLAKVWVMCIGRVSLFLLDCDVEGNSPEDRGLTSRLYGGDNRTRIRQELVAGVGGVRALRALEISPGVYHLNEGHSAFATLEAIRERMKQDGLSFDDALRVVAQHTVFTTHTPVPAGHDRFDTGLIEEHLGPLRDELGISLEQLMGLGWVEPKNEHETFCMTVLGLKLSRRANAVSSLHGHVTRRMWAHLWPWRVEEEIPIGHITNGVHVASWLAGQMQFLYDRHFPADWYERVGEFERLAVDLQRRPGRALGNAPRPEKPALGLRPPPRQPPVPPPRRKRRGRGSRPQHARSQHPHHRLRPAIRHLQAGGPDPQRPRPPRQDRQPSASARCRSSTPARPIRPTSRANARSGGSPISASTTASPTASPSSRITTSTSAGTWSRASTSGSTILAGPWRPPAPAARKRCSTAR